MTGVQTCALPIFFSIKFFLTFKKIKNYYGLALFVQEPGKECDASLSILCGGSRMLVFGSLFGVSWVMPHSVWKVIMLEGTFWKEK